MTKDKSPNLGNDCAPAQYRIKTQKPTRSSSNGVFLKSTRELQVFGFWIFRSKTFLIRQGNDLGKKKRKDRVELLIAALFALIFAIAIEIARINFFN